MTGLSFLSIILLMICAATAAGQQDLCPYKFITKTGIHEGPFNPRGARVDLVFGPRSESPYRVDNVSRYGILGPNHEYFQDDTVDVFFFNGTCDLICDVELIFWGPLIKIWNLEFFILSASYPSICDHTRRYEVNRTIGAIGIIPFNFCNEEVRTKKQKNTAASLLRFIGGMPS